MYGDILLQIQIHHNSILRYESPLVLVFILRVTYFATGEYRSVNSWPETRSDQVLIFRMVPALYRLLQSISEGPTLIVLLLRS